MMQSDGNSIITVDVSPLLAPEKYNLGAQLISLVGSPIPIHSKYCLTQDMKLLS